MHAVDDLSDAIDATRNFLTPIDLWLWFKLSLVVLLVVGASGGGPTLPTGDVGMFADGPSGEFDTGEPTEELPADIAVIVAVIVAIVVAVWLFFGFLGALMEFVFIESLRSRAVHVRRYSRQNLGRGTRLFLFRAILGLVVTAIAIGPIALAWLSGGSTDAVTGAVFTSIILGFLMYIPYAIVMRFTSEFVAPIMLLEDRGVLSGWRRFLGTARTHWTEYVVYLLLAWIIIAVVQFGFSFVFVITAIVLAIPFIIVIVLLASLNGIGIAIALAVTLVLALVLIQLYALLWMPIRSYFQYYALLVLGDTNPELDLIPELRAEIRADGGRRDGRDPGDGPDGGRRRDNESSSWGDDRRDDRSWDDSDRQDSNSDEYDPWDDSDRDDDDRSDRGW